MWKKYFCVKKFMGLIVYAFIYLDLITETEIVNYPVCVY